MTRTILGNIFRWRGRGGACLAALAGGLVVMMLGFIPILDNLSRDLDRRFGDWVLRMSAGLPERDDFVFLGIDDASMTLAGLEEDMVAADQNLSRMRQRFPWDRRIWGEAIERLTQAGARLVILDLVMSEPTQDAEDDGLAKAIARHRNQVLLAATLAPVGGERTDTQFALTEPLPDFLSASDEPQGFGYANFRPHREDGIVREANYTTTLSEENGQAAERGEPVLRSLAAEAIRMLGGTPPSGHQEIRWALFRAPGAPRLREGNASETYTPRSIRSIFVPDEWQRTYQNGGFFRGKVVMIGPAAPRFHDFHYTPAGMVSGPQLHLHAMANGMAGATVRRYGLENTRTRSLLCAVAVILAVGWVSWVRKPLVSALGAVGLMFLLTAAAAVWGVLTFQLISISLGLAAFATGSVMAQSYDLVLERLARGRLTREFRRFVSRDLADAMVADPGRYEQVASGRRRRVVVLFSDVRGFTMRSEHTQPEALVSQLNEYLTKMVAVVFRHAGTLDKFIGDAVMAHWGALDDGNDRTHAQQALAAAADMIAELELLNAKWRAAGKDPFKIGVGIHLGEVVAGEIGSPERTEFGVIGDAVNLASRIEGLTKYFGVPLLVSGDVFEAAGSPAAFRPVAKVQVKGRAQPVALHTLPGSDVGVSSYAAGLERFEAGDFAAADACFARVLDEVPGDGLAVAMREWAQRLRDEPPETWNGVIVMETK
ncbi:MAG: adenylate/guanylate cyclase domain-containing protein [Verrucomicrobia bacterium]|nr:adenylate/guanylate cyclase domain-containing protein [Verrucomicrobiota bacterium]